MNPKLIIGLAFITAIAFWAAQFEQFFTLENAKQQQYLLTEFITRHLILATFIYFTGYIFMTAFSIPGATVVTLLGAALFGFATSLVLVSFASTIGATLAFLSSRYLFRDWIQKRFASKLKAINQGVERNGVLYLFSLRLIPIFPFFLINLLMGLTPISTTKFYLVSQLGMLPGTVVYLNAGTQLANINRLSDIVSPNVIASFILLGLFPIITKWIMNQLRPKNVI